MSTSRHQSATTPSVIRATSATWMQPRHPTSTSRRLSSTSPSVTQTSLSTSASSSMRPFRAIVVTVDIGYVATAETSNVNIETEEPDIAIGEANETSYVIFDDILFGRLGAMRWSDDRHIERGCETSYLRDVRTSDIRHICGSRMNVHLKGHQPSACASAKDIYDIYHSNRS